MKILYTNPSDLENYNEDRFFKNLSQYGTVDRENIQKALKEYNYDPMHVSCLVEIGTQVIQEEDGAKKYYDDHKDWFNSNNFERLRRITGYLVGTLERWNDAKQAEEKARVKHGVGDYSQEEKGRIESEKLKNSIAMQI